MRYWFAVVLAAALVAACGSKPPEDPSPPEAPAFDVAAVRTNFTDECRDPVVVTDEFCEAVVIAGMTADGDILYAPTNLAAEARDAGEEVCTLMAFAHFDLDGNDLGYRHVGILDVGGGNLAACSAE